MIDFSISNKLTDDVIVNNDLVFVLQQIDLLFDTNPNTVLGDNSFGTNYDRYLYNLGFGNTALEDQITRDLDKIDLMGFAPIVNVTIVEGTVRDIAMIDITLVGNYENYNTTYVIK